MLGSLLPFVLKMFFSDSSVHHDLRVETFGGRIIPCPSIHDIFVVFRVTLLYVCVRGSYFTTIFPIGFLTLFWRCGIFFHLIYSVFNPVYEGDVGTTIVW